MAWEGEVLFECLRIGQYGNNEKSNYARKLWTMMNLTCELTFNLTSNSNNNNMLLEIGKFITFKVNFNDLISREKRNFFHL